MSRATTDKEIRDTIRKIKKSEKEITASKKSAIAFLHKTGLYTEKGKLRKVVS